MVYQVRLEQYSDPREGIKAAEERALKPGRTWGLGFLYRFEEHSYAASSGWDDDTWISTGPYLELEAFLIRSITPKGWTIEADNALGWRFIGREHTKRYALPTVEEALESFIARKEKQESIYLNRAKRARNAILLAVRTRERLASAGASQSPNSPAEISSEGE